MAVEEENLYVPWAMVGSVCLCVCEVDLVKKSKIITKSNSLAHRPQENPPWAMVKHRGLEKVCPPTEHTLYTAIGE
jgi:hypothetical protein